MPRARLGTRPAATSPRTPCAAALSPSRTPRPPLPYAPAAPPTRSGLSTHAHRPAYPCTRGGPAGSPAAGPAHDAGRPPPPRAVANRHSGGPHRQRERPVGMRPVHHYPHRLAPTPHPADRPPHHRQRRQERRPIAGPGGGHVLRPDVHAGEGGQRDGASHAAVRFQHDSQPAAWHSSFLKMGTWGIWASSYLRHLAIFARTQAPSWPARRSGTGERRARQRVFRGLPAGGRSRSVPTRLPRPPAPRKLLGQCGSGGVGGERDGADPRSDARPPSASGGPEEQGGGWHGPGTSRGGEIVTRVHGAGVVVPGPFPPELEGILEHHSRRPTGVPVASCRRSLDDRGRAKTAKNSKIF